MKRSASASLALRRRLAWQGVLVARDLSRAVVQAGQKRAASRALSRMLLQVVVRTLMHAAGGSSSRSWCLAGRSHGSSSSSWCYHSSSSNTSRSWRRHSKGQGVGVALWMPFWSRQEPNTSSSISRLEWL